MRISTHIEAIKDVYSAATYYQNQRRGLEQEFLDAVDAALARVEKAPEQFAMIRGKVRCCSLERFPYGIYFRIQPDCIRVVSVKHHRRNPASGMRRR